MMFQMLAMICFTLMIAVFPTQDSHAKLDQARTLKIATWNLWDYAGSPSGGWKAINSQESCDNNYVCQGYYDVITDTNYDLIFVQEIKGNFLSFQVLCDHLINTNKPYQCQTTANMGGSSTGGNDEGYGVIYKNDLTVTTEYSAAAGSSPNITQGTSGQSMARPPMKATVTMPSSAVQFVVFNNHIKTGKNNVQRELDNLESAINNSKNTLGLNVIVLGDLNADGGYYPDYGKGRCNNYYTSNETLEMDATYDDSDEDGDMSYPEADASDYYPEGSPVALSDTNFTTSTDAMKYSWKWIISNGFNLTLDTNPLGTSQGTNMPNAAREMGNRGCVYDRIIANDKMVDYKYNYTSGAVGVIPKDILHVPPRGKDNSVTQSTIPARTPFKNYLWNGTKGNDVYGLSDHKIIWAGFDFAAISPTDCPAERSVFRKNALVCFQGAKFQKNKTLRAYVIPYFPPLSSTYSLSTALLSVDVTTTSNGDISDHALRGFDEGDYLIIVDVDGNGQYDRDIDVQELFVVTNESGNDQGTTFISSRVDVSADMPATKKARTRSITKGDNFTVAGFARTSGTQANMVATVLMQNFNTGQVISASSTVTTDLDGNFEYSWNDVLEEGVYNAILHPSGTGSLEYNPTYDFIDFNNQNGLIVTTQASKDGFNDLVTIGANGNSSETFQVQEKENIYILAKNLPHNQYVDVYVANKDRLANPDQTWQQVQDAGNVTLLSIAVPLNKKDVDAANPTIQVRTSDDKGELFAAIATNLNAFIDQDYLNNWGKSLNVIIDVNRNGIFDYGDFIDTHKVDKILANIDDIAANPDATRQYQELLNAKLNLSTDLAIDGVYGTQTQGASKAYICSQNLDNSMSDAIEESAEIGFKLLLPMESVNNTSIFNRLYNYIGASLNTVTTNQQSSYACIIATDTLNINNTSLSNIRIQNKQKTIIGLESNVGPRTNINFYSEL